MEALYRPVALRYKVYSSHSSHSLQGALFCSFPQSVELIDSTPPSSGLPRPLSTEHVQPESLRRSCVTLVMDTLLVAVVVVPVPCLLRDDMGPIGRFNRFSSTFG